MWRCVRSMSTSGTSNSKALNDIQGQCRRLNNVGLASQKPTECSTIPLPTVTGGRAPDSIAAVPFASRALRGLATTTPHHLHYVR